MWSFDFDDMSEQTPRKKRKIDQKQESKGDKYNSLIKILQPEITEDLVTHSKKIAEVRNWLEVVKQSPEILLLTGPSGSAKTTTLRIVADSIGLNIQEWVNPVEKFESSVYNWLESDIYDPSAYHEPKQTDKFESFVFQSSRYKCLFATSSKRILLVEDFPNHFIYKPQVFHEFLVSFKESGHCPIVFICTDDEKINLAVDLFPNYIRTAFNITNIKFNPVSHTALMKVLKKNASAKFVPKNVLEVIAKTCNGDIRTALSSLQFSLAGKNNLASNKDIKSIITKDTSLDFFQTLGRVLYPKRMETPSENHRTFIHDVNNIADNYNNTFISMLHENYIDIFSNIKEIAVASAHLSDSDMFNKHSGTLKDYAALISVIGLMTSNKQIKKGTFKPLARSRWTGLMRQSRDEDMRPYPHLQMTHRVVNLDLIPFLKHMPNHSIKLSSVDVDRLYSRLSKKVSIDVFKVPPPPVDLEVDGDDDMNIEEFDD